MGKNAWISSKVCGHSPFIIKKTKLFLSRDRFGEKPLYYYENDEGFYFGSEIKFLKSLSGKSFSINKRHLRRHLAHGYKSLYKTQDTYFENVKELKYTENLSITKAGRNEPKRYWAPFLQNRSWHVVGRCC